VGTPGRRRFKKKGGAKILVGKLKGGKQKWTKDLQSERPSVHREWNNVYPNIEREHEHLLYSGRGGAKKVYRVRDTI